MMSDFDKKLASNIIEAISMIRIPKLEEIKDYVKTDPTIECMFDIDVEHMLLFLLDNGIINSNGSLYTINRNRWNFFKEEQRIC